MLKISCALLLMTAVLFLASSGRGQDPCDGAALNLIVQDSPVAGAGHQTEELFANATDGVEVGVPRGRIGKTTLYAGMVSQLDAAGGAQGWSIVGGTEGDIKVTAVTTDGTVAALAPEGIFGVGFNRTEVVRPFGGCVTSEFWSAVVLSLLEAVMLEPIGTATVLKFEVEASVPFGSEPISGSVSWLEDCCGICGQRCGQPCPPSVTVNGATRSFCELKRGATVTFVEAAATFRRGDSNSDGRVDISDAIRIFMYLFLGGAEPTCLDAADTNDDGRADLSDGVTILNDFFRPGTGISAPGPFECGADPTADSLGCGAQAPCD